MASRRLNPNKVKLHYSYTVGDLAGCLDVHKNTVRAWQRDGLEPIDKVRPILFDGRSVREYLTKRNRARKQKCPTGTLFCLRCRQPRKPALEMVEYLQVTPGCGNLRAFCECCETMMYRRTRRADIARILPDCVIQVAEAEPSISGKSKPSLNCDLAKEI